MSESAGRIDHSSFVPYYVQVKEQVTREIERGDWPPGSLLPSEAELCARFDVSRTVVRQAMQEMEFEGLIYRRRGKGSFVTDRKVHERLVQKLTGFYQDMIDQGHSVTNRVLRQTVAPAGSDIARPLGLEPTAEVVVIERLRLVNGNAINFSVSSVPYAICPSLLTADLVNQSLYAFIERACHQRIVRGRRTIEAILATDEIAQLLGVDADMPMFRITSICFLADGTPIEHARGYHRGDRSMFEVELLRDSEVPAAELPKGHTLVQGSDAGSARRDQW